MDIESMEKELKKGRDIEDLLDRIGWKEFEGFCSRVLEEHDWRVQKNFRFKSGRRYEIDILAKKGSRILAIDCKHWGIRPGKATQLRYAAEMQAERASELSRINMLDSFGKKTEFHPLIVTLLQEDINEESGVWIVPVFKLNNFLLNADEYLEP